MSKIKAVFCSILPGLTENIKKLSDLRFYIVPANPNSKTMIREKEILVADPSLMPIFLDTMPKLKWMQSTLAGVDKFFKQVTDTSKIPEHVKFTRMTGIYGPVMGEYVISQIISNERYFYQMHENQKDKKWDHIQCNYRLISDLTVGLMGFGDIGSEIARLLKALGCKVHTLTSNRKLDPKRIDKSFISTELSQFLNSCDYIVSILPSIPSTRGLLNCGKLEGAKLKKPVLINIGRGDLIDEAEILKALKEKWISRAILDVFSQEPLPSTSMLWNHPQVKITPHVSGFTMAKLVNKVFLSNLEKFEKGEPLNGLIDWKKGY